MCFSSKKFHFQLSIEDKIFKITLNRPSKFNALTLEMCEFLKFLLAIL